MLSGPELLVAPLVRDEISRPSFALRIAAICVAQPATPPFLPKNPPRPISLTVALSRTAYRNVFVQRLRLFPLLPCLPWKGVNYRRRGDELCNEWYVYPCESSLCPGTAPRALPLPPFQHSFDLSTSNRCLTPPLSIHKNPFFVPRSEALLLIEQAGDRSSGLRRPRSLWSLGSPRYQHSRNKSDANSPQIIRLSRNLSRPI